MLGIAHPRQPCVHRSSCTQQSGSPALELLCSPGLEHRARNILYGKIVRAASHNCYRIPKKLAAPVHNAETQAGLTIVSLQSAYASGWWADMLRRSASQVQIATLFLFTALTSVLTPFSERSVRRDIPLGMSVAT